METGDQIPNIWSHTLIFKFQSKILFQWCIGYVGLDNDFAASGISITLINEEWMVLIQ